jgi:hypothetical protein
MSREPGLAPARSRGYEESDARPSLIFGWLLGLSLALGAVVWLVGLLFADLERRAARRPEWRPDWRHGGPAATVPAEQPPAPRLQSDPAGELALHRALEARRTGEYAWVDRPAGVVRVPVERAMELLLERGLPVARERRR